MVLSAAKSLGRIICFVLLLFTQALAQDAPIFLKDLIDEALINNPEIHAAEARASMMEQKISQEASPMMDPMLSLGYQNDGLDRYTYGEMPDSQWMVSLEQTFPFPGKLSLQKDAATLEAESERAMAEAMKREVKKKVTEAYYDLLLITKEIDILESLKGVTEQLEKTALSLYASGMMTQEEIIMIQTEKYMIMEKQEMARGRRDAAEAMLKREIGRVDTSPLGRLVETELTSFPYTQEELVQKALDQAYELNAGKNLVLASEKKLARSEKEALPDVTLMASYSKKGSEFEDMWGLTASIPLPIFYGKKQGAAIREATWDLARAKKELEALKLKVTSEIRDNMAMIRASEKVLDLYRSALEPKARQQIDATLALLAAGKMDATDAVDKLKAPFDYKLIAWQQQIQREKAIARIIALTGDLETQR
jgi:outer membrane protein TolC